MAKNQHSQELIEKLKAQYSLLSHAMQSGVKGKMDYEATNNIQARDTNPKHLRVGVNAAMVDSAALARILMKKGIITELEYWESLCQVMAEEVEKYTKELSALHGATIKLL